MKKTETAFLGLLEWEVTETIEQRARTLDRLEQRLAHYEKFPEGFKSDSLIARDIAIAREKRDWLRFAPLSSRLSRVAWIKL